jgi:predicted dehydrogenase
MTAAHARQSPTPIATRPRKIVRRTLGNRHGPITQLMSPGSLGQLLKPFVFLDLFEVGVSGVLEGGAAFSIHYRGGVSRGTNLLWEINGTEGDLQLTAAGGQAQIFEMTVHGGKGAQSSLKVLPVPEPYRWLPPQGPGPSTNVAQAYARFARDYREGTHLCPTFDDAVTRHRMLNAIETAAATGQRQALRGSGEVIDRQLGSIAVTVGSI